MTSGQKAAHRGEANRPAAISPPEEHEGLATGSSGESLELVLRPSTDADDAARDEFVRSHERASFFHQSGWRRVIRRVYGHFPRDLVAFRGKRCVGVLPLMETRSLTGGRSLISVPYGVYGGPLGETQEIEVQLREMAKVLAEELKVKRLEIRNRLDPGDDGMLESSLYYTFIKDLPRDPEDVLKGMPKKARAEARKARKQHGLELVQGEWFVQDLCRLFFQNKHSLGSPGLPLKHFQAIQEEFGKDIAVHIVRKDRQPVSAVMSFCFRDTLIAYYAGTVPGADRACSASNFMYMALQEWAVEQGYGVFDFCRSRADSGAFSFKRHQGFEPQQLHYRFHQVKAKGLPSFNPSNPKTRVLRDTWSKLPIWFTQAASERLARYLP
ncbi:MAG: FemAB-related protein (PEP-CTERM system-associated) [Planctomycetota bacterium]|jgi:FemAB-related protein (PEP-CTERM system-associated)